MDARSTFRRALGPVVTVAAVLAVGGCGGPGTTPEQWTDQLCGGMLPFVRTATTPPPQAGDPVATTRQISDYLGRTTAALDQTLTTVEGLGPAPVDGGDAVNTQLRDGLSRIRSAFATSKSQVDALDLGNPAALQAELPRALAPVSDLGNTTGPLAGVTGNPQLSDAFRDSANCRELADATRTAQDGRPAPTAEPGRSGQGGGG